MSRPPPIDRGHERAHPPREHAEQRGHAEHPPREHAEHPPREHAEHPPREHAELAPEDARLVARVRDAFAPTPLAPAERTAFDARLAERLERSRRRLGPWPALGVGLATASLAALLLLREEANGPPAPAPVAVAVAPEAARPAGPAWAADLLYDDELATDDDEDDDLPAEYAAIAGLFLDR